ncbi:BatD family protein [Kistimonas asteriae]|uniref:BatD family protein n=1 Tax=Kistimonas asteriae TaxID=517724 RepID=UPI001BA56736|nr:BatD family protein [Kistimonas asteriae]
MVRKTFITPLLSLLMAAIMMLSATPALATFTASVDRTVITQNETLDLTLRVDSQSFRSQPDTSPLKKDFDILGNRRSSQFQMINGKTESWTDWIITLAPKRAGAITIPALSYDGEISAPIHIDVRHGNTAAGNTNTVSPVFMQTSLSLQELYIQQQTVLTLKIYYNTQLVGDSSLTPLEVNGAIVQQLGEVKKYEELVNGRRHGVFEVQYAINPQESGTLTIPSLSFTSSIAAGSDPYNNFFSMQRARPVRAQSADITLDVKPVPKDYPANTPWLPASNLRLTQKWSSNPDDLKAGDSVTRTLMIEAKGLTAAQLPPVTQPAVSGLKTYPDQAQNEDLSGPDGITGKRTEATALVPTHAGTMTLPAIHYTWFNTTTGKVEQARLPATTITVSPGNTLATPTQPAPATTTTVLPDSTSPQTNIPLDLGASITKQTSALPWIIATAVFALLWLVTLGLYIRSKKGLINDGVDHSHSPMTSEHLSEKAAFQQLQQACQSNDLLQIKQRFIIWAGCFNNLDNLYSLSAAANTFHHQELNDLLNSLEQSLYSGKPENAFDSARLQAIVSNLRKTSAHQKHHSKDSALSPINP